MLIQDGAPLGCASLGVNGGWWLGSQSPEWNPHDRNVAERSQENEQIPGALVNRKQFLEGFDFLETHRDKFRGWRTASL